MTFDENSSVRYVMKDMDPSEELLFEKSMMEDENLLIEVESLKKVQQRLTDLPELNPPVNVTRNVLLAASDYNRKQRVRSRRVYLSAAATLLITFAAGAFFLFEYPEEANTTETAAFSNPSPSATHSTTGSSLQTIEPETERSSTDHPAPWVDNNQELHFIDRFSAEHAEAFDSLLDHSMQRLRPLQNNVFESRDAARSLHLTGQNQ